MKVAVVTGSNKGIGFCIVRALCKHFSLAENQGTAVYLTSRDPERGKNACQQLIKEGYQPRFHILDIESDESVKTFAQYLKQTYGGLDILINNAAISYFTKKDAPLIEQAEKTLETNYFGTLKVFHALGPLLRPEARIVNISSALGHLSKINAKRSGAQRLRERFGSNDITEESVTQLVNEYIKSVHDGVHKEEGWPNSAYVVSKLALSALTIVQQREFDCSRSEDNILVNSVTPGWVRSDMTGHKGFFSTEEGSVAPTWAALLPPSNPMNPKGDYIWHDMTIVDWRNGPLPS